ncbi:TPA: ferritin [Candidatus Latescibacteria bacterium]|nr:ferritin [Candidatus Latescibacterota bacterium]
MIAPKMLEALNEHLNVEFYSAYYYLAMAAHFEDKDFKGFATWMRMQYQEELAHAAKFFDFINDREGVVQLTRIETPPQEWDTPLAVFERTLEHEQEVTQRIYNLVDLSLENRDHATNTFLQWFVTEQVEEEATASEIIQQLKLVGNDGNGLFLMDRELGQRMPADEEGADAA